LGDIRSKLAIEFTYVVVLVITFVSRIEWCINKYPNYTAKAM